MMKLQQQATSYVERLQTDLYEAMMWVCFVVGKFIEWKMFCRTASPQTIPPQTYDYAALNMFALGPQDSGGSSSNEIIAGSIENDADAGNSTAEGDSSVEGDPSTEGDSPAEEVGLGEVEE